MISNFYKLYQNILMWELINQRCFGRSQEHPTSIKTNVMETREGIFFGEKRHLLTIDSFNFSPNIIKSHKKTCFLQIGKHQLRNISHKSYHGLLLRKLNFQLVFHSLNLLLINRQWSPSEIRKSDIYSLGNPLWDRGISRFVW